MKNSVQASLQSAGDSAGWRFIRANSPFSTRLAAMRRLCTVCGLLIAVALGLLGWAQGQRADLFGAHSAAAATPDNSSRNPGLPTLKQTLDDGLKARTPGEKAFNDKVVKLVHDHTLPLDMVDSTFLWARHKPTHQMEYFEKALAVRAEKIGVHLDVHLGE
jgi:hypothetical protein